MAIEKAIQIYLDWKRSHTISAFKSYKKPLLGFMEFISPKGCVQEITGDDVTAYHRDMEKYYSPASIAYSARILKNFFWFWKGRGIALLNPKEIIPIRFINADKDIVTASDFELLNEILDERYHSDLQKKLIINLLWDTGMRVSELLDLKIRNISEQGSNGLRSAKIRSRKTMRYNLVVWGANTNDLLNRYLGIRLCLDTDSDMLLINKKTKKVFTPRSIQRWISELSDLAALDKKITPHSFRHGKANEILERGGNVRDVSAILRHVNPNSSFNYLQLSSQRYMQTAEKFLQTSQ